jgi:hypothetical protein
MGREGSKQIMGELSVVYIEKKKNGTTPMAS